MSTTNVKVDEFLEKTQKWQKELQLLRKLVLECGLTEEYKWRQPCYSFQGSNIVLLGNFKDYCSLSFFKGVLLKDDYDIMVSPGKNSQSVKLIKFLSDREIINNENILKTYIYEAIEVEKLGIKVVLEEKENLKLCSELIEALAANKTLKAAFESLTPGRQRGYNLYFSAPKQQKTKIDRIEKYTKRIIDGYGFHDCVCGHSKKMPTCDGSHKYI
ncbi:DUF1801 domain-containing protein [Maribacter hydrothermalis]|uniref:YdhG-like domain-containing protein n=1 Tax=Maribacter hydrothermalis TaxID=1836467 RepID=A0A1B7Z039_9FLAO|nr:DUF1801 domain-containing protein [Maribacter hydrothermalis]APQ16233.1 hypothetical protein BTR34_02220 [Maribacter hydrothermalis]OBR36079.1 hypothetical protein A9200_10310 [Maribacter hydrothermalis]